MVLAGGMELWLVSTLGEALLVYDLKSHPMKTNSSEALLEPTESSSFYSFNTILGLPAFQYGAVPFLGLGAKHPNQR